MRGGSGEHLRREPVVTTASDSTTENSPAHGGVRRLLIWDAPNMDMCLAEVIRHKASGATRPRMDAVAAWMAARCKPGERVEACVFANVGSGHEEPLARWVANLRDWGWSVFVKPKTQPRDDIDAEMIRYIERPFRQGSLVELIVASHDSRAFAAALQRYAQAGVEVTVLGYRERERVASTNDSLQFLDVEDVPDAFVEPLPRTNLFDLPSGGRWFGPFANLAEAPVQHVSATPSTVNQTGKRTEQTLAAPAPVLESPPPKLDTPTPMSQVQPLPPPPVPVPVPVPAAMGAVENETAFHDTLTAASEDVIHGLTRHIVVDVLVDAARSARDQMLTLKEAAAHLGTMFPGFSLEASGYENVGDLLDDLHRSGMIQVIRFPDGHRLVARASTDSLAVAVTDTVVVTAPATEAGPDVIDLTGVPHPPGADELSLDQAPHGPATDASTTTGFDVDVEVDADADADADANRGPVVGPAQSVGTEPSGPTAPRPPVAAGSDSSAGAGGADVVELRPNPPRDPSSGSASSGSPLPAVASCQSPDAPHRSLLPSEEPRPMAHAEGRAASGHPIYRAFKYDPQQGR